MCVYACACVLAYAYACKYVNWAREIKMIFTCRCAKSHDKIYTYITNLYKKERYSACAYLENPVGFLLMQTKEMKVTALPFHTFADSGGDNMSTSAAGT